MSFEDEYQLKRQAGTELAPLLMNTYRLVVVGMIKIEVPESDFSDSNPLPYGHTAYLDDGAELWVCRIWADNVPVAYVTTQLSHEWDRILAIHDWRMDKPSDETLMSFLLAFIATAPAGLRIICANEVEREQIHRLIGPVFFDMHEHARITWNDYERYR